MTWIFSMASSLARHGERHEGDHARALDGERHLALVLGAVAADAPGDDLAPVGDEVLERLRVLVVDLHRLVGAEAAHLAARETAALATATATALAVVAATVVAIEIGIEICILVRHGLLSVSGLLGR